MEDHPNLVPGYRDLSIVHSGAGAVTYRAVDEGSDAIVALRVQYDRSRTPPDELAALERASRDDHVVTVLETGYTTTGRRYTVSLYCNQGDLASSAPLPMREAVQAAVSAGKGLRALHSEGLIHGDMTPGRLLHAAGGPLLTGMATLRGLAAHSTPGVLEPVDLERVGLGFAAPEVLLRRAQTAASDVYGLGATLWSLLAGRIPFDAGDRSAAAERALTETEPPTPLVDVPQWLADILAKAMASDPADRYPTVRAFTDALEEGLRDAPALPIGWRQLPERLPEAADPGLPDDILGWGGPPSEPSRVLEFGAPAETLESLKAPKAPMAPEPHPTSLPQHLEALMSDDPPVPPAVPSRPAPSPRESRAVLRVVVALAIAVATVGTSAAGFMYWITKVERRPQAEPERSLVAPPTSPTTRVPPSAPAMARPGQAGQEYAPGQVKIVDSRVSIEVTWEDRSGGRAAHHVVGGPRGRTTSTLTSAPPGTEKVMVSALNPSVDYCLTVVAVVDVDRVARAEPVCTRRGIPNG
jgi:serine/threonine protein kinase